MNEELMLKLLPALRMLRTYHRHEVSGTNHIPNRGPAIIASTHSLATYDLLLLMAVAYEEIGRFPRSLIDHLFYKVPGVGKLMGSLGCVPGNPKNAKSLLSNGELLCLAPGGMKEALRSSKDKYKIYWKNRLGFARLSLETGAPVILAACPGADDLYDVYDNQLSSWFYKQFKVPFFIAKGLGLTAIPKPVRLKHYLSDPIVPPRLRGRNPTEARIKDFHQTLSREMEALISRGIQELESSHLLSH